MSKTSMARMQLRAAMPQNLCGNLKQSCSYRRKNKSCDCTGCIYNIQVSRLSDLDELLVVGKMVGVVS